MTIQEMHYDFKKKLNKIDSQQYKNLLIPEIDWILNEAQELFVKIVANPRKRSYLGFEINQRSIDDIRTLVRNDVFIVQNNLYFELPDDYMFFISGYGILNKEGCREDRKCRLIIRQHDDKHEESPFDKSSYDWKEINGSFVGKSIKLFIDKKLTAKGLSIDYIKRPDYIHNAQDFLPTKSYKLPNNITLSGFKNCKLPEHTHREIVDIAVLIATNEIQSPDYKFKEEKLKLSQLQ